MFPSLSTPPALPLCCLHLHMYTHASLLNFLVRCTFLFLIPSPKDCAQSLSCDPLDCSPPGSSVYRHSPVKNTEVDCRALLQEIFPTQGLNPDLLHCRQILYQLNYQGSPTKNRLIHTLIYLIYNFSILHSFSRQLNLSEQPLFIFYFSIMEGLLLIYLLFHHLS